jgi:class 3 adenylate cyclase
MGVCRVRLAARKERGPVCDLRLGGPVAAAGVRQQRIGSDSGQVITGEIGTAATGYTAIGDPAQRMESVAPLASFFKQVTQAVERCDEFSLGAGAQQ